jgi:hypothetical protein
MRIGTSGLWFCAGGCQTGPAIGPDPTPCDYQVLGTVPLDVPGELGFSGEDVIALASTDTTGEASAQGVEGTWEVELHHLFSSLGDATEIEYIPSDDTACPRGQALMVPVSHVVDGAIGDWWVQGPRLWMNLIATAATVEDTWTSPLEGGDANTWGGTVDSELEDLARTTLNLPTDCNLGFSVGPSAEELFPAPGTPDDGLRGWADVACDTTTADFLSWTAERVVE